MSKTTLSLSEKFTLEVARKRVAWARSRTRIAAVEKALKAVPKHIREAHHQLAARAVKRAKAAFYTNPALVEECLARAEYHVQYL